MLLRLARLGEPRGPVRSLLLFTVLQRAPIAAVVRAAGPAPVRTLARGLAILSSTPATRLAQPALGPIARPVFSASPISTTVRGIKTHKRQIRNRTPKTKYKLKTRQSVAKRFMRMADGKLKYWPSGRGHLSQGKNRRRLKAKRQHMYVTGTMFKKLDKMLPNSRRG